MPSDAPEPVTVPYEELDPDTLTSVIESFVLREGTDYGAVELTLEQKVARVHAQLKRREIEIRFDPETESITFAKVR